MKIYGKENVYEAALNRIRWIFDEFPNVIVGFSGGKDSTVIFHLCHKVAKEKGRLPLKVLFIDQEAEWEATIEQVRRVMYREDVDPLWFQIPIKIFNATSVKEHWLMCWDPAEKHRWMREQEEISIKENKYGTDRFKKLFGAIIAEEFPETKTCYIAGVRAEESPARYIGLTQSVTYKWATWGVILDRGREHYTLYPMYDWSYTDVWKTILDNDLPYNRIYDIQFKNGMAVNAMRVSNVHHETAVPHLFYMQKAEPETYEKLAQRIEGVDMSGKMGEDYFVKNLPFMFKDWKEYRDFLLEKLITDPEWKRRFKKNFARCEKIYGDVPGLADKMYQVHISSILTNDWEQIKVSNWERSADPYDARKIKQGRTAWSQLK